MRRASRTTDSLSRLPSGKECHNNPIVIGSKVARAAAIVALLELPDPPDLRGRGYHYTCARDPRRDPEILKRDLGTAYVAWRRQDHVDGSGVVSVRRQPHLRMVKQN